MEGSFNIQSIQVFSVMTKTESTIHMIRRAIGPLALNLSRARIAVASTRTRRRAVFEDSMRHLHVGDLETAEKAYRRIEVRDSSIGHYSVAYGIGLNLAKGNFSEAQEDIEFVLGRDPIKKTATLNYLSRLLRPMKFDTHAAEVIREHLLALADGGEFDL
jgi:hypothetical protein